MSTVWTTNFIWTIFKNSGPASHKTHCVFITKTDWLRLLKVIRVNTMCGQNSEFFNVKTGGAYRNHYALKRVKKNETFPECTIIWIIFKNSLLTSWKTYCLSITKSDQLILLRKIKAIYCEDHMKTHKNTVWTKCRAPLMLKQMKHVVTHSLNPLKTKYFSK
jgi:alpha-tubulin suppressor-like RCC1 family protein